MRFPTPPEQGHAYPTCARRLEIPGTRRLQPLWPPSLVPRLQAFPAESDRAISVRWTALVFAYLQPRVNSDDGHCTAMGTEAQSFAHEPIGTSRLAASVTSRR